MAQLLLCSIVLLPWMQWSQSNFKTGAVIHWNVQRLNSWLCIDEETNIFLEGLSLSLALHDKSKRVLAKKWRDPGNLNAILLDACLFYFFFNLEESFTTLAVVPDGFIIHWNYQEERKGTRQTTVKTVNKNTTVWPFSSFLSWYSFTS